MIDADVNGLMPENEVVSILDVAVATVDQSVPVSVTETSHSYTDAELL